MPTNTHKILIALTGGLGDALISIPLIEHIKTLHSDAGFCLLHETNPGKSSSIEAIRQFGYFDGHIALDKKDNGAIQFGSLIPVALELRRQKFTHLYYITSSTRSAKTLSRDKRFFQLCGIPYLHGFDVIDRSILFPHDESGKAQKTEHELHWRIKRLGLDIPESPQDLIEKTNYPMSAEGKSQASALFKNVPEKIATLMPVSGNAAKDWPMERMIKLAQILEETGMTVVCLGHKNQSEQSQKIIDALSNGVNACGKLGFSGSAAVIKQSTLFVGLDSSLAHLAGILGTPAIILFSGQSHPGQWYPLSKNKNIRLLTQTTDCAGCFKSDCPVDGHPCMAGISCDDVVRELENIEQRDINMDRQDIQD